MQNCTVSKHSRRAILISPNPITTQEQHLDRLLRPCIDLPTKHLLNSQNLHQPPPSEDLQHTARPFANRYSANRTKSTLPPEQITPIFDCQPSLTIFRIRKKPTSCLGLSSSPFNPAICKKSAFSSPSSNLILSPETLFLKFSCTAISCSSTPESLFCRSAMIVL